MLWILFELSKFVPFSFDVVFRSDFWIHTNVCSLILLLPRRCWYMCQHRSTPEDQGMYVCDQFSKPLKVDGVQIYLLDVSCKWPTLYKMWHIKKHGRIITFFLFKILYYNEKFNIVVIVFRLDFKFSNMFSSLISCLILGFHTCFKVWFPIFKYVSSLFLGFQTSFKLIWHIYMFVNQPLTMDRIHMFLLEVAWLTCM
jgi:hypothetical protein